MPRRQRNWGARGGETVYRLEYPFGDRILAEDVAAELLRQRPGSDVDWTPGAYVIWDKRTPFTKKDLKLAERLGFYVGPGNPQRVHVPLFGGPAEPVSKWTLGASPEIDPRMPTRMKLQAFAQRYGLRPDWHEPDEQGVTATVVGRSLDNAHGDHGWKHKGKEMEKLIVLKVDGKEVMRVNLATVLALATNPGVEI
jgi:hypothetical protein